MTSEKTLGFVLARARWLGSPHNLAPPALPPGFPLGFPPPPATIMGKHRVPPLVWPVPAAGSRPHFRPRPCGGPPVPSQPPDRGRPSHPQNRFTRRDIENDWFFSLAGYLEWRLFP